jgi:hypothetical protein
LLSEVLKIVLNGGIEVCTKSVRPSFECCHIHLKSETCSATVYL